MLNRDDIVAIGRSTIEHAIEYPPERAVDWSVRVTSGTTTGLPLVVFFERTVNGNLAPWLGGRTVVCYGSMSSRLSTVLTAYQNKHTCFSSVLAVDQEDLNNPLTACLAEFAPDNLVGFPSFMMKVSEYMDKNTARGVSALMIAGERLTEEFATDLKTRFPNARILQMYAAMELGYISALPCENLGLNQYHVRDGFDVEVEEPDANGYGALLISTTLNSTIPIVQYKTGDAGRVIDVPCACGAPKTLEILGRSGGDFVRTLGAMVRRDEFERTLALLSAPPDDYRLEVGMVRDGDVSRGSLIATFYYKNHTPTDALRLEMERVISGHFFLTPTKTLSDLVQAGVFAPLFIVYTDNPFPKTLKEVKLLERHL